MQKLEASRRTGFLEKARTFIAAVPLAATLITGCADTKNECRTHNETTVTLNQQINGKSVGVKELESIPNGSFLSIPQIDFINEAHALSSEWMPNDVKATQVQVECSVADDSGKAKAGYTQPVSTDDLDRGVYIPKNPDSIPFR